MVSPSSLCHSGVAVLFPSACTHLCGLIDRVTPRYPDLALVLFAQDLRARVGIQRGFGVSQIDVCHNARTPTYEGSGRGDNGIYIAFQLGSLSPGQSTSVRYGYVLDFRTPAEINQAVNSFLNRCASDTAFIDVHGFTCAECERKRITYLFVCARRPRTS